MVATLPNICGSVANAFFTTESITGAVYTDEPAVVDGNIVTTAHYKDLGIWMKTALDLASKGS